MGHVGPYRYRPQVAVKAQGLPDGQKTLFRPFGHVGQLIPLGSAHRPQKHPIRCLGALEGYLRQGRAIGIIGAAPHKLMVIGNIQPKDLGRLFKHHQGCVRNLWTNAVTGQYGNLHQALPPFT